MADSNLCAGYRWRDRQLTLISTIRKSQIEIEIEEDISGIFHGCFVSDNKFLLVDLHRRYLYLCKPGGSELKSIELDFRPRRVTCYDNNQALVTSSDNYIQIINTTTGTAENKIDVGTECYHISSRAGMIWVTGFWNSKSLTAIDINGKVIHEIKTKCDVKDMSVHQSGDVYFTSTEDEAVRAVTPEGQEREVYSSPELLGPDGITIDDNGDIYVAGFDSNNIHCISSDGKHHCIVPLAKHWIVDPSGLAFNNDTKEIMVITDLL